MLRLTLTICASGTCEDAFLEELQRGDQYTSYGLPFEIVRSLCGCVGGSTIPMIVDISLSHAGLSASSMRTSLLYVRE